jgi:hypothetical protein
MDGWYCKLCVPEQLSIDFEASAGWLTQVVDQEQEERGRRRL